ncbi:MAG: hypothetical protein ACPLRP_01255 [Candidatus Bipolaricaulaceae bacterium]
MNLVEKLEKIIRENPEVAIILAEILAPPPSLSALPKPWET